MIKKTILVFFLFSYILNAIDFKESNILHIKKLISRHDKKIDENSKNLNELKTLEKVNESKIKNIKSNIDSVNKRIDDLYSNISLDINLYGILITVLIIIYTILNYFISKAKIENALDEMKNINNKAKLKLKNIEKYHTNANNKNNEISEIHEKLIRDLELENVEESLLSIESKKLKNKPENIYNFDDWWIKFLNYFNSKNYENALYCLNNILENGSNKVEKMQAYLAKGVIYGFKKEHKDEMMAYDEVIMNFQEQKSHKFYGSAMIKKSLLLSSQGKFDEAIEINNRIISIYKDIDSLEIKAVKALVNNIELSLIKNNEIENEYKLLMEEKFKNYTEDYAIYEMFLIIQSSFQTENTSNNVLNLNEWKEKYENYTLMWRFDELDKWLISKNKRINEKLNNTLNIFKMYFVQFTPAII